MAEYKSPYALQPATMNTYKPSTNYSELTGFDPYRNMSVMPKAEYKPYTRTSHTTEGGFGGLGSKANGGYSYVPDRRLGLSERGLGQGLLDSYNNYMNPEAMSGATYQGDYGTPVELTYGQLDAIKNPTQGSEATGLSSFSGMDMVNAGLNAANAYGAYQQGKLAKEQLGLARDQFKAEQAYAAVNLANQADLSNQNSLNRTQVGLALAGNTKTDAERAAAIANTKANYIARTI